MTRANSLDEYKAACRDPKKPVGERIRSVRMARDGVLTRACPTEHEEQVTLFEWATLHERKYPALKRMYAIANAGAGAQSGQAGKMKGEGVKPDVPDICLAAASSGHHGLYIELKALDGVLRPSQAEWLLTLRYAGYAAEVAFGWEEARDIIEAYIEQAYLPRLLRSRR